MEFKSSFNGFRLFFFLMKAAILDFDGVIANTLQVNFDVNRITFQGYGIELKLREFIDYWVSPEAGKEGIAYFVKLKGIDLNIDEFKAVREKHYKRLYLKKVFPMPGAFELIALFKAKNVPLAIVSSNYRIRLELFLEKFSLENEFQFIIGSRDSERRKPFPDPFLAAAKRLGVKPEEVLVIEDADTGVQGAKAAGCSVIAVPNRFTAQGDFSLADAIVNNLSEIGEALISRF
jgi:HAD superfamily hydrolase (TIGR01509 family)